MSLRHCVFSLLLAAFLLLALVFAQDTSSEGLGKGFDLDNDTSVPLVLESPLIASSSLLTHHTAPIEEKESQSAAKDEQEVSRVGAHSESLLSASNHDVSSHDDHHVAQDSSENHLHLLLPQETISEPHIGEQEPSPAKSSPEASPSVLPPSFSPHVVEIASSSPIVIHSEPEVEPEVRAIQLIYPSEDHELLLVNETSLAWLASFDKPVAIVAVCGPLHSGKSFLMNQLLNRTSGFALGPTTEPKTRGLWMWNVPVELEDHLVIFLDTEGLFASNISEAYDAKIFAISSLMSSYLIYNSVKFIDQSAIDYIELLARRAQLFGVKAEISTSDDVESLDTFVSPPKLLWIVQDFVQEMANGITPQEWLVGLLASRKKTESTASSLPELFKSVDCFTLFLPEYRRFKLRHLDQVDNSDLLPEYRADMKILRDKVYQEADVKLRGKFEKLTGLGAAALLRTLVTGANKGAFPEVPSIWKTFLALQTQTAIKDAIDFYENSMDVYCSTRGPFNSVEMLETHSHVINETKHLFSKLTFGFKDLEEANIESLLMKLSRLYSTFESGNAANLTHLCQEKYKTLRDQYRLQLWHLELPMKKSVLQKRLSDLSDEHLALYRSQLSRYQKEESFATYMSELTSNMKGDRNGIELSNADLLQQVIANASSEALLKCSHFFSSQDTSESGIGATTLKEYKQQASQIATRFFNDKAGFALEDLPTAPAARKALETEIQTILTRFDVLNAERIERRAQKVATGLAKDMSRLFDDIRLPQTRTIIESKVSTIKASFLAKYDEAIKDVIMMEPANLAREKLFSVAANDLEELFRRNNVKYDRIISDSLPTLKQQIAPILDEYWWPPAAEEYARRAVNATLQSVELIENEELVADLANRFIDANLREEIQGIWKKLGLTAAVLLLVIVGAIFGLCFRRK